MEAGEKFPVFDTGCNQATVDIDKHSKTALDKNDHSPINLPYLLISSYNDIVDIRTSGVC